MRKSTARSIFKIIKNLNKITQMFLVDIYIGGHFSAFRAVNFSLRSLEELRYGSRSLNWTSQDITNLNYKIFHHWKVSEIRKPLGYLRSAFV